MSANEHDDELLEALTRRAERQGQGQGTDGDGGAEAESGDFDLVRQALDATRDPEEGLDITLGGYMEKHDRPPAFTGSDGQPYTVGIEAERGDAAETWVAFLVFPRWAATGAGIMEHVETGDLACGATEDEARAALLELSLYEVKAELDAALERRRALMEE